MLMAFGVDQDDLVGDVNEKILNIIKEVQGSTKARWHSLAYFKDFSKVFINLDIFRLKMLFKIDRIQLSDLALRKLVADGSSLVNFDAHYHDDMEVQAGIVAGLIDYAVVLR
jgi:hypothetical protein